MNDYSPLEKNLALWLRDASAREIEAILNLVFLEMLTRSLPGADYVNQGAAAMRLWFLHREGAAESRRRSQPALTNQPATFDLGCAHD